MTYFYLLSNPIPPLPQLCLFSLSNCTVAPRFPTSSRISDRLNPVPMEAN
jgi:hypothetical protein